MSLINGSRDQLNHYDISGLSCGMNVTSTMAVRTSQLAIQWILHYQIFVKWLWKAQSLKETFDSEMRFNMVSVKRAFSRFSGTQQKCMVFINPYWKDGRSGKIARFCKHKPVLSTIKLWTLVICSSLQSTSCWSQEWVECNAWHSYRHLLSKLQRPVRRHLIESIYWRLSTDYTMFS